MRHIFAALTLLLGLVLLVLGIGQLNAESEETITAQTEGAEEAPFTVITEELIDAEAERQEFTIDAEGEYSLAVGRTFDIEAWLGDAAYNRVTGFVEAEGDEPPRIEAEYVDGEAEAPNPIDSDLWVATETTEGELLYRWSTPDESGEWALLIFRDGEEPAPAGITVEQTEVQSQAPGIALLVGGSLAILLALGLFYWASRSRTKATDTNDRSSGADDDGEDPASMSESTAPSAAEPEEQGPDHQPSQQDTAADEPENRNEFSIGGKSLFSGVVAMILAAGSAAGLAGPAHADDEATEEPTEEPTAEATEDEAAEEATDEAADETADPEDGTEEDDAEDTDDAEDADEAEETEADQPEATDEPDEADAPDAEDLEAETDEDVEVEEEIPAEGYSVLLSSQLEHILEDIAEVVEAGDAEQDSELLQERVAGDALNAREVAYRNAELADAEPPAPIGTEVLSAAVTSDQDFPRTAVVITDHPDSDVPQILMLQQESPRDNYQLTHISTMAPGTEFPSLSAEQGGSHRIDPEAEIDGLAPADAVSGIAEYYTDSDHDFGASLADSVYMDSLHGYYQDLAEAADDTEVSFPDPEAREGTTALQLPDGSTVVAGSFDMVMQMAPLEDGDTIFLDHDLVVELVETDWTTFPTEISTIESVVLHLPAEGSDDDVVLLGVHDIIEDASIDTPEWFDGYDG